MTSAEFEKHIDSGDLFPCYLIGGEDEYWAKKAYKKLLETADELDVTVINAPTKFSEALLALETYPMLGDKKIVAIEGYEKFGNEEKAAIIKYLEDPVPTSVLILYNSEKITHKNIKECDFPRLREGALIPVINSLAQSLGGSITQDAARLMSVYAEFDMAIIEKEVIKLSAYCGNETITVESVKECVTPNITYRIYDFADALSYGSYKRAYGALESLTKSASEYSRFLANAATYYRTVFYAKISKLSDEELAKALGTKPYPVKKARAVAAKYSPMALYELLKRLYELEFEFKSGRTDSENALELAIAEAIERRGK